MRGQPDLWGEIHEDEIVKIAREAAEKRGYAVYSDFDKYMEQEIAEGRLKPTRGGRYHHHIKEVLEASGWKRETAYRPTRFYPPGSEEATP